MQPLKIDLYYLYFPDDRRFLKLLGKALKRYRST